MTIIGAWVMVAVVLLDAAATTSSDAESWSGTASASAAEVDPCVTGTWTETSHRVDRVLTGIGTVLFTGHGARYEFGADGTVTQAYGPGYVDSSTVNGHVIEVIASGSATFHYATAHGVITYKRGDRDRHDESQGRRGGPGHATAGRGRRPKTTTAARTMLCVCTARMTTFDSAARECQWASRGRRRSPVSDVRRLAEVLHRTDVEGLKTSHPPTA